MPTKKARAATKTAILKFDPDWIRDPPPPFFRNLDRAVIRELEALKRKFAADVKQILAKGQR